MGITDSFARNFSIPRGNCTVVMKAHHFVPAFLAASMSDECPVEGDDDYFSHAAPWPPNNHLQKNNEGPDSPVTDLRTK